MITYALVVATAVLLSTGKPGTAGAPVASSTQETVLRFGDQVRVQGRGIGSGWVHGVVGDVNGCMVILVPEDREGRRVTSFRPIPIDNITAAQRRNTGRSGGEWVGLSVEELRRRHGKCTLPGF